MVKILLELSEDVDKDLQYYMLDNNIKNKKIAIQTILINQLKK